MGLTLFTEQNLRDRGLIRLFDADRPRWAALAAEAYAYVKRTYPANTTIRRDDLIEQLANLIWHDQVLASFLDPDGERTRKSMKMGFVDLIIDREWDDIPARQETACCCCEDCACHAAAA
jgi:hypothetical protein